MHTPADLNYRMPAEWEHHRATWLTWPRPDGISFPERYDAIPDVYAEFIRILVQGEEVHINMFDAELERFARNRLTERGVPLEQVHFHPFPAYEPWCRDHGPIFLVRNNHGHHERAIVDWGYNAWGGKYPPCDLDDAVPQRVAEFRRLPLFSPDMVLEGGSIDVNGRGTLLTTESCLLNPNRNPTLSQREITGFLKSYLGVTQVLWLGDGIVGDDTDGHVDDLTRFVGPSTVVTIVEEDPNDANFAPLQDNYRRLRTMHDQAGHLLRIVKLPTPGVVEHQGQRLPASYANFYAANSAVIVPTFGHPNDRKAIEILQKEFHDRRVVGLDSRDLIWGLGSFHCISQQEPS